MKGETWYASGAPRGANMRGRVLIFRFSAYADRRLVVSKVLDGEQHGEYFGASLSSCDINNDGKSEIIVGAPQWSKEMEEGRVYAYIVKNNVSSIIAVNADRCCPELFLLSQLKKKKKNEFERYFNRYT